MRSPTAPLAAWLVRNRSRLPGFLRAIPEAVERNPDGIVSRLAYRLLGGDSGAPEPLEAPSGHPNPRVLVGPANYAGQGTLWARALERDDDRCAARSLAVVVPGAHSFPADATVPFPVYRHSPRWQHAQRDAVLAGFDHILLESMRPLFGSLYPSIAEEMQALRDAGISVALMAHGTDFRSPARHLARHRWSPFSDDPRADRLQRMADANIAMAQASGAPLFVSTPDLLDDVPGATWCPVVVDLDRWTHTPALFPESRRPVVAHIPSSARAKGTHLIEPALRRLDARGVIEYRRLEGIPSEQMPAAVAASDIVLDQFRVGSYGVAACEAMAAGRVVVGHVVPEVRRRVTAETGQRLPIVEADPDTLEAVLESLVADPAAAAAVAVDGRRFVEKVHSGAVSASVLARGWFTRGNDS